MKNKKRSVPVTRGADLSQTHPLQRVVVPTCCAHFLQLLFSPRKHFLKGFTKRPLLTSQENFGWDHKWILSMASGCMTRLYKQWSAYSGRSIPGVKEILDITEKLMKTDLLGKIDLFKPWICTSCKVSHTSSGNVTSKETTREFMWQEFNKTKAKTNHIMIM